MKDASSGGLGVFLRCREPTQGKMPTSHKREQIHHSTESLKYKSFTGKDSLETLATSLREKVQKKKNNMNIILQNRTEDNV